MMCGQDLDARDVTNLQFWDDPFASPSEQGGAIVTRIEVGDFTRPKGIEAFGLAANPTRSSVRSGRPSPRRLKTC